MDQNIYSSLKENDITQIILQYSFKIHSALGPGLLESVYEECLFYELIKHGFYVERQKSLPVSYEGIILKAGFRIDLFVENKVIIELKAVEALNEIHFAQTLTHLRLSECKVGLLINFNVASLKNGIKRIVNKY
ncbi:MAG TPA: GxxExxY protein [Dyadobacter sp.]|jgi:GxxExxY protein|nr:GxxExxY protein [Dyadobacter sp.]